jgi:hypothetical protein
VLLDAAVLTIVIGVIAGGRLGRLKDLDPGIHLASFVLLLVGLWLNRHLPGVRLVGLGAFLNFLVIAANGGSMPVDRGLAERAGSDRLVELLDSPDYTMHEPATEATRLRPLADVLPLPMVPRPGFFSPGSVGDILVTVGACWLILHGLGAFGLRCKGQRAAVEDG